MKIEFVSDISCPWCVVGLKQLEQALELVPDLKAQVHFEPFELNPTMAKEGEDTNKHLSKKFGGVPAQFEGAKDNIRRRGAEVGFTFSKGGGSRIWNTFDAHRLIHWAGTISLDSQRQLNMALFEAHFTDHKEISSESVLVATAVSVGLDGDMAWKVVSANMYASEVRQAERKWRNRGIHSVPTIVVNGEHLISGSQSPQAFASQLRAIHSST